MIKQQQQKLLHYLYSLKSFGIAYHNSVEIGDDLPYMDISQDVINNCMLCDANKITQQKTSNTLIDQNIQLIIVSTLFIGDPNQKELLSKMVQNVLKIPMKSVAIIDCVKCIIEKEQFHEAFVEKCIFYAKKQLKEVQYNIPILFLGDSYYYLTKQDGEIGKIVEYQKHKSLLLPELDFILKNPSCKIELFESLKRMKLLMEKM